MALATLKQETKTGKWMAEYQGQTLCKSANKQYVIDSVTQGRCNKAINLGVTGFVNAESMADQSAAASQEENPVDINERFQYLEDFTQMTIDGSINSLIVTGEGGLGKTHTITKKIEEAGLEDVRSFGDEVREAISDMYSEEPEGLEMPGDYLIIKGYSTSKALYRSLWENRRKLIVFDDCDKILEDAVAINILKGALDSYGKRLICWNAELKKDDQLPRSFHFEGQVIFISNKPQWKLDQALKSRSLRVDLSMTPSEKIKRMTAIVDKLETNVEVSKKHRQEALKFIEKHMHEATDLNVRTLMNIMTIRATATDKTWQKMAHYTLTA